MSAIQPVEGDRSDTKASEVNPATTTVSPTMTEDKPSHVPWHMRLWNSVFKPGSATQIIIAAVIAIAIGLAVTGSVSQSDIPEAAPPLLTLLGDLWLRALRATVLPLIICAIILAVQNLKAMTGGEGSKLAWYTIIYYMTTTIIAILHSVIITDLGWRRVMQVVTPDQLGIDESTQERLDSQTTEAAHEVVISVFTSFIPRNVVGAVANDDLLAVLVTSAIVGALIRGPDSSLLRAVKEVERIVAIVITWLIKAAPVGVFFLILGNIMTLDMEAVGVNLGVLIGSSISHMAFQLFVIYPTIFFVVLRKNPYTYWARSAPSWVTAWGSASSAATLPVTIEHLRRRGVAEVVIKFTAPLGALVNMDGTAIYFPIVVVFLAITQGQQLNAGDYALIVLLSVLSSIATTPIPSSSLVLTVIIAESVGIEVTGMYAVVVSIDWFIDRFRTMTNVSGDLFAAAILQKLTGITDDTMDFTAIEQQQAAIRAMGREDEAEKVSLKEKREIV